MKYIIILVIVLGALGGAYLYFDDTIVVQNPVTEVVEKVVEKEVNPIDAQIEARERELEERYEQIKKTEARRDVLVAEREKLDREITQLNKDLAGFMTATTSKR